MEVAETNKKTETEKKTTILNIIVSSLHLFCYRTALHIVFLIILPARIIAAAAADK